MILKPITYKQACDFIKNNHRHHKPPQGHKFSIGIINEDNDIIGCCVVGRPVSRVLDNGFTAEVTRLCTDGHPNACSKLYAAAWRAAKAMGYTMMVTYILSKESGKSVLAAGWKKSIIKNNGGTWSTPSRIRIDKHPIESKQRYEIK